MDRVGEFLKVAEVSYTYDLSVKTTDILNWHNWTYFFLQNVGIDKGDIPDLTKVRATISSIISPIIL